MPSATLRIRVTICVLLNNKKIAFVPLGAVDMVKVLILCRAQQVPSVNENEDSCDQDCRHSGLLNLM
jgi:hypothetical protein